MNLLTTATWSTLGGAALGGSLLAKDQAKWAEVDNWAEELAAADRHQLLNGQPLPAIQEPPQPPPPNLPTTKTWLLIPLAVWLVPAALIAIVIGASLAAGETPAAAALGGVFAFIVASIPTLLLAVIVGLILKTARMRRAQRALLEHQIQAAYHDVWALREDARHQLTNSSKPGRYLEAIGLNPQQL